MLQLWRAGRGRRGHGQGEGVGGAIRMGIEGRRRGRSFCEQWRGDAADGIAREDHGAVERPHAEGGRARRRKVRRAVDRSGCHYKVGSQCGVRLDWDMVRSCPAAQQSLDLGQHETPERVERRFKHRDTRAQGNGRLPKRARRRPFTISSVK